MAFVLVGRENPDHLFRDTGNWVGYLYRRLPNPFRDLPNETVSFLTFNYDRSLEHFLFSALSDGFGADEPTCVAALEKIPIIHLHGSLGPLRWQARSERNPKITFENRPYETVSDGRTLGIATKGIRIVHEDVDQGKGSDFPRAKHLLRTAKQIYFLGFGYDQINMQRLDIQKLEQGVCFGTGLGLTSSEVHDIEKAIDNRISIYPDHDCLGFLRNEVSWS